MNISNGGGGVDSRGGGVACIVVLRHGNSSLVGCRGEVRRCWSQQPRRAVAGQSGKFSYNVAGGGDCAECPAPLDDLGDFRQNADDERRLQKPDTDNPTDEFGFRFGQIPFQFGFE